MSSACPACGAHVAFCYVALFMHSVSGSRRSNPADVACQTADDLFRPSWRQTAHCACATANIRRIYVEMKVAEGMCLDQYCICLFEIFAVSQKTSTKDDKCYSHSVYQCKSTYTRSRYSSDAYTKGRRRHANCFRLRRGVGGVGEELCDHQWGFLNSCFKCFNSFIKIGC